MRKSYLLTLQCMNRPGIVAGVATRLAAHGGNITAAQQFDDPETDRFFMRVAFDLPSGPQNPSGPSLYLETGSDGGICPHCGRPAEGPIAKRVLP